MAVTKKAPAEKSSRNNGSFRNVVRELVHIGKTPEQVLAKVCPKLMDDEEKAKKYIKWYAWDMNTRHPFEGGTISKKASKAAAKSLKKAPAEKAPAKKKKKIVVKKALKAAPAEDEFVEEAESEEIEAAEA